MLVPKLRFKEFTDEWEILKLKNIAISITKGTTPKNYSQKGISFIKVENVVDGRIIKINSYINESTHLSELKRSILKEGDILFSIAGSLGRTTIINKEHLPANTNQALSIIEIKDKNKYNIQYIEKYLNCNKIKLYIKQNLSVGAQPNLNLEQVGNIKIPFCSNEEQEKIARLFTLLDKLIELQQRKIEALKLYKLYTFNNLFNNTLTKEIYLKQILKKWTKKNIDNKYHYVESVSNKYGFIAQSEQFEDRNVASLDKSNYYVIEENVFAYNPSRLNVGSLALKDNDKISLVSPLYECFTTSVNNKFLLEWFNSSIFKRETYSRYEGGVRNTLTFNNLTTIPIRIPNIETQEYLANFFEQYKKEIIITNNSLEKLNLLKKGLLQQMFV